MPHPQEWGVCGLSKQISDICSLQPPDDQTLNSVSGDILN